VRLLIGVCQCQLLTKASVSAHIYNVTGSSVAVSLDNKFKSEVTKAQQLKSAGSKGVLVSGIQDKNAVVSFSC
jgi:hypothetical protein